MGECNQPFHCITLSKFWDHHGKENRENEKIGRQDGVLCSYCLQIEAFPAGGCKGNGRSLEYNKT